jgi:Zn-dependent protease
MQPEFIALGALWYVAFLFSLTCHEAAHALAAHWGGDPTAAEAGQVTLNPLPHIRREIFGTTIVPILSYVLGGWMIGWGSAPFDPHWRYRHPRRAAWMALAGPAANLTLMLAAVLAIRIGILAGALEPPESARFTRVVAAAHPGPLEGVAVLLSIMFSLNLLLAMFNLLPLPPLDGHGAICLLFTEDFARRFIELTHHPSLSLIGLVVSWKIFGYLYDPIFLLALNILYPGAKYG